MKKLLFFIFLLPLIAMSQEKKVSFGVKAGINFSNTSPAAENMLGFSIGGFASYPLNKVFSLNGELLFTKYAYDFKNNVSNQFGSIVNNYSHFNFSKIELPIYIKASAKSGVIKPFAYLGFSHGINVSAHFKQDPFLNSPERDYKLTNINAFNLSLTPGIGLSIKDHFIFDVRYNVGITNQYTTGNTKVNTCYLTLGYKF